MLHANHPNEIDEEVAESHAPGLHESLRRSLPGYLVPRLVREVAAEPYKRPV